MQHALWHKRPQQQDRTMPQAGEGQDEFCQKEAQEIEEREGKEGRGKGEEEAG